MNSKAGLRGTVSSVKSAVCGQPQDVVVRKADRLALSVGTPLLIDSCTSGTVKGVGPSV